MTPEEVFQPTGNRRTRKDVLNENEVVMFMRDHFISRGFDVAHNLTHSRGVDLTASHAATGETWLIECKGEIKTELNSDGSQSPPFTSGMCRQSIEAALFKTMACQSSAMDRAGATVRVGMAFPNTPHYRSHIGRIARSLEKAKVTVFLVSLNGTVREHSEVVELL